MLHAIITNSKGQDLEKLARMCNNANVYANYFYVNGNRVSYSNANVNLSDTDVKSAINWFLQGCEFSFNK